MLSFALFGSFNTLFKIPIRDKQGENIESNTTKTELYLRPSTVHSRWKKQKKKSQKLFIQTLSHKSLNLDIL